MFFRPRFLKFHQLKVISGRYVIKPSHSGNYSDNFYPILVRDI